MTTEAVKLDRYADRYAAVKLDSHAIDRHAIAPRQPARPPLPLLLPHAAKPRATAKRRPGWTRRRDNVLQRLDRYARLGRVLSNLPLHAVTCRYIPLQTVTDRYRPLHTVTYRYASGACSPTFSRTAMKKPPPSWSWGSRRTQRSRPMARAACGGRKRRSHAVLARGGGTWR